MKPLVPYLFFNGNCNAAMNFYKDCFGGKLDLMTYADMPPNEKNDCTKNAKKDDIMHSELSNGTFRMMASDWPDGGAKMGNTVQLSIDCQSMDEIQKLFKKLSQNGKVLQPLADTFWGAHFGMLIDQFDIHWMLNYDLKK